MVIVSLMLHFIRQKLELENFYQCFLSYIYTDASEGIKVSNYERRNFHFSWGFSIRDWKI